MAVLHGVLGCCYLASLICITVLLSLYIVSRWWPGRPARYAPSPPGHPLVGHSFQLPKSKIWSYFERLSKVYGPLVRLSLGGDDILVLSDPKDAEELLGRRSKNYSSRKQLVYAGKYQSQNKRLVLLPYGDLLKKERAAFHLMLQPRIVGSYEDMQEQETKKLLYDMLVQPTQVDRNVKRWAASLVFRLSYGKRLDDNSKDLQTVLAILDDFIEDCYPGAHLVDNFPILDQLPDFLSPWRLEARRKHAREAKFYGGLLNNVRQQMVTGNEPPHCFALRLLEQQHEHELDDMSMMYVAGSAFEAGTGTTAGTLLWFLLAAISYPEALARAQKEIDELVGAGGHVWPSLADMTQLPYCLAFCKEVLRWMPAAPGGFPHLSDEDDTYMGYTIRAKTMVIPNIWAMQHSEANFKDPLTFNPDRFFNYSPETAESGERFLTEGHWGFGFGRRICPGRFLAARSVWLGMTTIMWAFDIKSVRDGMGNIIHVDPSNCTSGITSEPKPFPVDISPRSEVHAESVRRMWKESNEEATHARPYVQ